MAPACGIDDRLRKRARQASLCLCNSGRNGRFLWRENPLVGISQLQDLPVEADDLADQAGSETPIPNCLVQARIGTPDFQFAIDPALPPVTGARWSRH